MDERIEVLDAEPVYREFPRIDVLRPAQPYPLQNFRLSWVAYLGDLRRYVIRALIIGLIDHFAKLGSIGGWLHLLNALFFAYQLATTWSVKVYTDGEGIWVSFGFLPWSKGVTGVQWFNAGEAMFSPGFVPWVCRSYAIRVTNRFQGGQEIDLRHVSRGNQAVEHINDVLSRIGRARPY